MELAQIIYQHSRRLPAPVAHEVLDFITFLEQRHGIPPLPEGGIDRTEAFLAAIRGGLEGDFPDDIDASDLGLDVPRNGLD